MRKRWYAAAVVAVALVLVVADSASAQRRLRGGRRSGGYDSGSGYGQGYYGGGYGGYGPGYMPGYAYSPNAVTDTTSFYYQPGTQMAAAVDPNAAVIEVRVPPNAQVSFDGDATAQTGPNRLFSSPSLDRGQAYHYTVKARWTQNGQPVERTRRVEVRAGQSTIVDFTQDQDRNLNRDRDRIEE
jgi:uncharacterized protein (TIGR03000 family)